MAENPDIILVWPKDKRGPRYAQPEGYTVAPLAPAEDDLWVDIHRLAIPSFSVPDLRGWLARYRTLALADGILVARDKQSRRPIATAGSLADGKSGMFPSGGQLGWVATVPAHRGRGLATWLCGMATERLLAAGFDNIFVSTGDEMLPAIRVYLGLGYLPCLYAPDQRERWIAISRLIPQCQECQDQGQWVERADYVVQTR